MPELYTLLKAGAVPEADAGLLEVMTHFGRHPASILQHGCSRMKFSGQQCLQRKWLGLLRQQTHSVRAFTVRQPLLRGRRHSTRIAVAFDESTELAVAEVAHRLRTTARAALDSIKQMAGQQPSG